MTVPGHDHSVGGDRAQEELATSATYGFGTSVVRKLVLLVYNILFVRMLGVDLYALYVAFDTVLRPCATIVGLGGPTLMVKEIAEERGRGDRRAVGEVLGGGLLTVGLLGALGALSVFVLADLLEGLLGNLPHLASLFRYFSWIGLLGGVALGTTGVLVGFGRTRTMFTLTNLGEPIAKGVGLAVIFLLFQTTLPRWSVILAPEVLALGLTVMLGLAVLRGESLPGRRILWEAKRRIPQLLRRGAPLMVNSLASMAFLYTDKAMIAGIMGSPYDLAAYSVALTLAGMIMLFHQNLLTVVAPQMSAAIGRGEEDRLPTLYRESAGVGFVLASTAFLGLLLLGPELLALFDPGFDRYVFVLAIVGWGHLVDTFAGPGGYLLIARGRSHYLMNNSFVTITLNVVLNFLLITRMGVVGAAIATAASAAIRNGLILLENLLLERLHPLSTRHLIHLGMMLALTSAYFVLDVARASLWSRFAGTMGVLSIAAVVILRGYPDFSRPLLKRWGLR